MPYRARLVSILMTLAIAASPGPPTLTVSLYPLHGSNERGTATITQRGSGLIITIHVTGTTSGASPQFAHFHRGTCEHIATPTVYELEPIRNGQSTTQLTDIGFEALIHGEYSIVIHKTLSHGSPHVSCGTVAGA
ncbi:MAG: hypothetical protein ABSD52_04465 [Candidatus Cybelea sp.]